MINISNKKYWLVEQAKKHPTKVALHDSERELTYAQLLTYSINTTHYFRTIGIKNGDHISIVSNNSIEFVITINALWLLGATPVPLNLKLRSSEIEKLVLHSKSKILLNIDDVIDCSNMQFKNTCSIRFDDFTNSHNNFKEEKFNLMDIALMMYSSGSTGEPKCVQLTFNNLFESAKSLRSLINQERDDLWLASLPFFHIGGFSIITRSLIVGSTLAFTNSFSFEEMIKSFAKHKPTYFSIVPTMLKKMLELKVKPWNELKNIFIGGGPLNTEDVIKAIELGFPLIGVYGSTETASMVTAVTEKNKFKKSGCTGKPLTGSTIKIIDSKGLALNKMEIGEIVISSKCVAKSYFDYSNDKSSKISNQNFHSNDLGYVDEEGDLFLVGRKDDMIISGGENINLNEIENFIKTIENIFDCTTIKVKDEKWGESYILLIVLKVKSEKSEKNILTHLRNIIASFKQPKSIHFVDDLFRNELGKIDKKNFLTKLVRNNNE